MFHIPNDQGKKRSIAKTRNLDKHADRADLTGMLLWDAGGAEIARAGRKNLLPGRAV
jgi:hypothetical protein